MRIRLTCLAILTLSILAGGATRAGDAWTEHRSPGLGLAFEITDGCTARDEVHHPDDPARQISHSVIVNCGGPDLLRVDMWVDPAAGDVATWVGEHLGPLLKGAQRVVSEVGSRLAVPTVVIERGHTPQTAARRLVALKLHGRVYVLTLEMADEERPGALLDRALGSLRVLAEGGR
ncbi:MAG: hypothetical protein ABIK09_02435 [Pseudomonadota bacterium]